MEEEEENEFQEDMEVLKISKKIKNKPRYLEELYITSLHYPLSKLMIMILRWLGSYDDCEKLT